MWPGGKKATATWRKLEVAAVEEVVEPEVVEVAGGGLAVVVVEVPVGAVLLRCTDEKRGGKFCHAVKQTEVGFPAVGGLAGIFCGDRAGAVPISRCMALFICSTSRAAQG